MVTKEISDKDFLALRDRFEKLNLYHKYFETALEYAARDVPIPEWVHSKRKIDGREISLGLEVTTQRDEFSMIRGIRDGWSLKKYRGKRELLDGRLERCRTYTEKEWLLQAELEDIKKRKENANDWFLRQYESEVSKIDFIISPRNEMNQILGYVTDATATYHYEVLLSELLRDHQLGKKERIETIDDNLPKLDTLNEKEKLTLCWRIGLIESMENKSGLGPDRKKMSQLLCLIFGISLDSKTASNLYDSVKKMYQGDSTKTPINAKNLNKVDSYLKLIGISLEKSKK